MTNIGSENIEPNANATVNAKELGQDKLHALSHIFVSYFFSHLSGFRLIRYV